MRFFLLVLLLVVSYTAFPQKTKSEKIILDTDFGNDCDDAGALAILHQMAYSGEAEILATMYPMNDEWGAAAIDAVNTYYGKPNIPTERTKEIMNTRVNTTIFITANWLRFPKRSERQERMLPMQFAISPDTGRTNG